MYYLNILLYIDDTNELKKISVVYKHIRFYLGEIPQDNGMSNLIKTDVFFVKKLHVKQLEMKKASERGKCRYDKLSCSFVCNKFFRC